MSAPEYVIVDRHDLPKNVQVIVENIPPDLVVILDRAQKMHVGRRVLVQLFEWFLGIVEEYYGGQPNINKDEVVDESFVQLMTKATKLGLTVWEAHDKIFSVPEEDDAS